MKSRYNKIISHPLFIRIIIPAGLALSFWEWIRENTKRLGVILFEDHVIVIGGWWIAVIVSCAIFSFVFIGTVIYNRLSRPAHLKYTEAIIFGLKWRWSWKDMGLSVEAIRDLYAYCQDCESELMIFVVASETTFECGRCDMALATVRGDDNDIKNNTKREILRRIRSGEAYSRNHSSTKATKDWLPLSGKNHKITAPPSSTTNQSAIAMEKKLINPSARQIRIISELLEELPENGPSWIGGKTYTISKLTTQHP